MPLATATALRVKGAIEAIDSHDLGALVASVLRAAPLQIDEAFSGNASLIECHRLHFLMPRLRLHRARLALQIAQLYLALPLGLGGFQVIVGDEGYTL